MAMSRTVPHCEFDALTLATQADLTIPGHVEAIEPAVEKIMAAVGEMGCASGKEFEIEIALTEALANAVEHGCEHDPDKNVEIWVGCDHDRGLLIVVRDPGLGFDPKQIPSPIEGEQVYREGGRGIYLINRLMDHVHYDRGGTEIRMLKR
jgi:serine/threonine-protein kinase RsbW